MHRTTIRALDIRSAVAYYDSGPGLIEEDALRPPTCDERSPLQPRLQSNIETVEPLVADTNHALKRRGVSPSPPQSCPSPEAQLRGRLARIEAELYRQSCATKHILWRLQSLADLAIKVESQER
ncbi:hypothetical protein B0H16DRAFT_1709761 [Mycena metata]|uniref:Uncharacterized protein n=1 Tax=Mycena metata TaxID=1033252 RepID=A0AAD7KCI2_9AGAR|nr:hypothetical protein B0H16DRAFT_1709761 [Mycena metata]